MSAAISFSPNACAAATARPASKNGPNSGHPSNGNSTRLSVVLTTFSVPQKPALDFLYDAYMTKSSNDIPATGCVAVDLKGLNVRLGPFAILMTSLFAELSVSNLRVLNNSACQPMERPLDKMSTGIYVSSVAETDSAKLRSR
jgi:hypothetical protein